MTIKKTLTDADIPVKVEEKKDTPRGNRKYRRDKYDFGEEKKEEAFKKRADKVASHLASVYLKRAKHAEKTKSREKTESSTKRKKAQKNIDRQIERKYKRELDREIKNSKKI